MRRFHLFLFFLLYGLAYSSAQRDSLKVKYDDARIEVKEITEDDLTAFRSDPKFDYEVTQKDPTWWDDFKTWLSNLFLRFFEWVFGIEEAAGALVVFLRILPYLLLALLLFFLIRFFINTNSSARANSDSNKAFVSLSEEEHIIKNEDIQALIRKALDAKDYRLAVRYYYLYILQLLSDKELIDWQLQKTNHDYENEIETPKLRKAFTKITRLYDYVWYGAFSIDAVRYQKVETLFSELKKTLKNG